LREKLLKRTCIISS